MTAMLWPRSTSLISAPYDLLPARNVWSPFLFPLDHPRLLPQQRLRRCD
jgi:hypothetical protein